VWAKTIEQQQRLLGWCIRELADHTALPSGVLNQYHVGPSDTFNPAEDLEITCEPLSLQDLSIIWDVLKPHVPLSVGYIVHMVPINRSIWLRPGSQTRTFDMGPAMTFPAFRAIERQSLVHRGVQFVDDVSGRRRQRSGRVDVAGGGRRGVFPCTRRALRRTAHRLPGCREFETGSGDDDSGIDGARRPRGDSLSGATSAASYPCRCAWMLKTRRGEAGIPLPPNRRIRAALLDVTRLVV
jgi:hypothetical protein